MWSDCYIVIKFVIAKFIKVCKDSSQNFVFVVNMFYCNVCFVYRNQLIKLTIIEIIW